MVSQTPSSPDPLEVSSMLFCLGTCGAGSARTGGDSRAQFSPVFFRVQTLLAEQSWPVLELSLLQMPGLSWLSDI